MEKTNKIAVIGLGYVGLPLALLADRKGFDVLGIDLDKEKVALIKQKISPYKDEAISESLKSSNLTVTTDPSGIADANSIIICVPTPVYENHMPNLEPVKSVSKTVATYLKPGQLVVLESTVNPGVSENIIIPILEESGLKAGIDFYIAHCPERINPGDKKWNVSNIPRVVGSLEPKGLELVLALYRALVDAEIMPMGSLKEAESVKVVENSFRDINIAFANRARYYDAFKEFERSGKINIMEEIIGRALTNSYHKRLAYLEGKMVITLNEYAKQHKLSHSNLLNKASRQTIPAFLEKGVWKVAADTSI
ncbi:MAG: nucleotide sugar dehydrogenase [bacterium]|nr:nucleotide sugar dehydrogenase [bacterium]